MASEYLKAIWRLHLVNNAYSRYDRTLLSDVRPGQELSFNDLQFPSLERNFLGFLERLRTLSYLHPDCPLAFIIDFDPTSEIAENSQEFETSNLSRARDEILERKSGGGRGMTLVRNY